MELRILQYFLAVVREENISRAAEVLHVTQAILESGWGKSKLAAIYHNYFGMKCGTKWTGKSVNMTTQEEYTAGTLTTIKDNFRVYDSMEEGIKGYLPVETAVKARQQKQKKVRKQ